MRTNLHRLWAAKCPVRAAPFEVIAWLDGIGSQGTVASPGSRYFGFIVGGALPTPLAASWLASTWDQNVFCEVSSPIGAHLFVCLMA